MLKKTSTTRDSGQANAGEVKGDQYKAHKVTQKSPKWNAIVLGGAAL
jgi:hypothetical protein